MKKAFALIPAVNFSRALCATIIFFAAVVLFAEESVWIEPEHMNGISGYCYTSMDVSAQVKGSWGISGPGVAPEWTLGGESGWLSIACRADEPEAKAWTEFEVPATGRYTLWVRYGDYCNATEEFGVTVTQEGKQAGEFVFGTKTVIDDLDQIKLQWKWAFAWDSACVDLKKGNAILQISSLKRQSVPRQVDAFCITNDWTYRPYFREKPVTEGEKILREYDAAGRPAIATVVSPNASFELPEAWKIKMHKRGFIYLWNVRAEWFKELQNDKPDKIRTVFNVDSDWLEEFRKMYGGKDDVPIYSHPSVAPCIYINDYPGQLLNNAPFIKWLESNDRMFGVLLNYGSPQFKNPATEKPEAYANFNKYGDRFLGYISGENLGYFDYDAKLLNEKVKSAKNRNDLYQAVTEVFSAGNDAKYTDMYGKKQDNAWDLVIPCQSCGFLSYAHPAYEWGVKTLGHENSSCFFLPLRLAYLRGGARQYDRMFIPYRSCNFGDASTIYSNLQSYQGTKFVLDNWYDAWAGAGMDWYKKDIYLFYFGGASGFYQEQGFDEFWKPGGNAFGQREVQLSPKGRIIEHFLKMMDRHPDRGTPFTPVAFLIDIANGWDPQNNQPTYFDLDRSLNPSVLTYDDHAKMTEEWYNVAYHPVRERWGEPATGSRQTYVPGTFGDIFDVIATSPSKRDIVKTYPVVVCNGEIYLTEEWGKTLAGYMEAGGTLVATEKQLSGPGVALLKLPSGTQTGEANSFVRGLDKKEYKSNTFRYTKITTSGKTLAETQDGNPVVVLENRGKGLLMYIAIHKGLGIDGQATPALALTMLHVTQKVMPLRVNGLVEYSVNKTKDGWLVVLVNNEGVYKSQHGISVTDYRAERSVTITTALPVKNVSEWETGEKIAVKSGEAGASIISYTVPAGAIRILEIR